MTKIEKRPRKSESRKKKPLVSDLPSHYSESSDSESSDSESSDSESSDRDPSDKAPSVKGGSGLDVTPENPKTLSSRDEPKPLPEVGTYRQLTDSDISQFVSLSDSQLRVLYSKTPIELQLRFKHLTGPPLTAILKIREAAVKEMLQRREELKIFDAIFSDLSPHDLQSIAAEHPEILAKLVKSIRTMKQLSDEYDSVIEPELMNDFAAVLAYKCQLYKEVFNKYKDVLTGMKGTLEEEMYAKLSDVLAEE